jgi:hypothetical protein
MLGSRHGLYKMGDQPQHDALGLPLHAVCMLVLLMKPLLPSARTGATFEAEVVNTCGAHTCEFGTLLASKVLGSGVKPSDALCCQVTLAESLLKGNDDGFTSQQLKFPGHEPWTPDEYPLLRSLPLVF